MGSGYAQAYLAIGHVSPNHGTKLCTSSPRYKTLIPQPWDRAVCSSFFGKRPAFGPSAVGPELGCTTRGTYRDHFQSVVEFMRPGQFLSFEVLDDDQVRYFCGLERGYKLCLILL